LWIPEKIGRHPQTDKVAPKTTKGRTLKKSKQSRQEGSKGVKDLDDGWSLYLRKERSTANGIMVLTTASTSGKRRNSLQDPI
jgi:hypothetical protein